ncbi:MAG: CPBP family glutamic-type intramembrane protease [Verrucomicrobiales bacterium]|nr:CPBP family glutamic-type intramembrane protease [Verrucomicrobiales bacterium]
MKADPIHPQHRIWLAAPFAAMALGMLLLKSGWAALLLYHAVIIAALVVNRERASLSSLLKGFSMGPLLLMLVIAAGLYFGLTAYSASKDFVGEKVSVLAGSCGPLFVVYLLLVNPPLEELFWRDLFAAKSKLPSFGDLLFGCFHFPILLLFLSPMKLPIGIAMIAIGGWGWRQMRNRYGGLLLPWAGHFLADLTLVAVVLRLLSL